MIKILAPSTGGHPCHTRERSRPAHLQIDEALSGTVAARADGLGVRTTHLSLSHDAGIASAVVVAEG